MYVAANFFKEINAKKDQKKSLENIQKSLPSSSFATNNESNEKLGWCQKKRFILYCYY